MALNTTQGNALHPGAQAFYDKKLLENARPHLAHYQFAMHSALPKNSGKIHYFRRWNTLDPIPASEAPLDEGVTPQAQDLSNSFVSATVAGYGRHVEVSDLLELTFVDNVISGASDELGAQGGKTMDGVIRDCAAGGTVVRFAGAAEARSSVSEEDKLTVNDIRKAVRQLKNADAPKFDRNGKGYYVAIIHPDAVYDLQSDALWQDVSKYSAGEQIFDGELGKLFGVIFVESTQSKIFKGAGAAISGNPEVKTDVYATLFFGRNAYGCTSITDSGDPNRIRIIVKSRAKSGISDPLEQRSSIGWKVDAFAAAILNDEFMVRVEHSASAN
ncbi:MAG: N4-gp56 family major capsid protein [Christensenellales bacterium]|jgi:N4-gp56 family major capsid protein